MPVAEITLLTAFRANVFFVALLPLRDPDFLTHIVGSAALHSAGTFACSPCDRERLYHHILIY